MNKKIIIVGVILIVVIALGYILTKNKQNLSPEKDAKISFINSTFDKYGFSMNIPKDWVTKEKNGNVENVVVISPANIETIRQQNSMAHIRINMLREGAEVVRSSIQSRGDEIININGIEMHKENPPSGSFILFQGKNPDILFTLYFSTGKDDPEYYKNIFEQVLTSFKFL